MKNKNSQSWFGLIILVASAFIFINDFIIVPKQSKDYLISCYESSFLIANSDKPLYLREQFYACLERDLNVPNLKSCWNYYAADTYQQFIGVTIDCPTDLYHSRKILFNK